MLNSTDRKRLELARYQLGNRPSSAGGRPWKAAAAAVFVVASGATWVNSVLAENRAAEAAQEERALDSRELRDLESAEGTLSARHADRRELKLPAART